MYVNKKRKKKLTMTFVFATSGTCSDAINPHVPQSHITCTVILPSVACAFKMHLEVRVAAKL